MRIRTKLTINGCVFLLIAAYMTGIDLAWRFPSLFANLQP